MEVILLQLILSAEWKTTLRFNPCFYGSYSFTRKGTQVVKRGVCVLILVFMEVILLQGKVLKWLRGEFAF